MTLIYRRKKSLTGRNTPNTLQDLGEVNILQHVHIAWDRRNHDHECKEVQPTPVLYASSQSHTL